MLKDCFEQNYYPYVNYPEMLRKNKELVAQVLCAQGGRRWQKGNLDRVYFQVEALGFSKKCYQGSLSHLEKLGIPIHQSDRETLEKLPRWAVLELKEVKCFVDLNKADWVVVSEERIAGRKRSPRFVQGLAGPVCLGSGSSFCTLLWEVLEARLTEIVWEALKKVSPIFWESSFDSSRLEPDPYNIFTLFLPTEEECEQNKRNWLAQREATVREFYS